MARPPWFNAGIAVALLVTSLVMTGCSSTESFEEPAPLPEVEPSVNVEALWEIRVGGGHDGQLLYLQPWISREAIYVASHGGRLVAVDPETGKTLWRKDLDRKLMAGVGGDQERLYLVSQNAELIAIGLDNQEILWEIPLPNEVLAPPRSNSRVVVVQTIDGNVLAVDVSSGERTWLYSGAVPTLTFRATGTPVVGDQITLAGFASGRLFALSSETGQPLWQYAVGRPEGRTELERLVDVTSSPVVVNTAALVVGYQGKLAFVDLRNGQELWSREASSFRSPALGSENVFIATSGGDLVAFDGRTRRELWRQKALSWRQLSQPIVVDDYLLVGDYEGYIHVLSQAGGKLVGQYRLDDEGIRVPPYLLDDRVLFFGNGGTLALLKVTEGK